MVEGDPDDREPIAPSRPGSGSGSGTPCLVGRSEVVRALDALVADAMGGGTTVVVSGPGGIGKSAVARAVADRVEQRGGAVVWAPCRDAEGAPALWPWAEVLRGCVPRLDRAEPAVSPRPAELLRRLVPALTSRTEATLGEVDARHRAELAAGVLDVLAGASRAAPLLVVLEDVHAADPASLEVLRIVAERLAGLEVGVLVTCRDAEGSDVARRTIAERRVRGAALDLPPLDLDAFATLVETSAGPAHPDVVARVHALTGGNPLFGREVARLLAAEGRLGQPLRPDAPVPVPEEVRAVVRERTAPLSAEVRATLEVASVIGATAGAAMIATATGTPVEAVVADLDVAARHGLVEPMPASVGRYRFPHDLVREAIYDRLSTGERMALHGAVAAAIEATHADDLDPHLSEVAHHRYAAAPSGDRSHLLDVLSRAAQQAADRLAFEEAATHHRRRLAVLAALGPEAPRARVEATIDLADALRRAGSADARAAALDAVAAAHGLGEPELHARAALLLRPAAGMVGASPTVDGPAVRALAEAAAALPDAEVGRRAEVLAALGEATYWSGDLEEARRLTEAAVDLADEHGTRDVRARVLSARLYTLWGPDSLEERLTLSAEVIDLATASGDPILAFLGRSYRLGARLEQSDLVGVQHERRQVEQLHEALGQPTVRWALARWAGALALLRGRHDLAEAAMEDQLSLAEAADEPAAVLQYYGVQLFQLRDDQGRLGELEPLYREQAEAQPHLASYWAALAYIEASTGDVDAARARVERILQGGLDAIPRDMSWTTVLALLCRTADALGDAGWCSQLLQALDPHVEGAVVVGDGTLYGGSVAHWAGLAARGAGHHERAVGLLEAAADVYRRMEAEPLLGHAERDLADVLATRGEEDDHTVARALLERAAARHGACDMGHWQTEALRRLAILDDARSASRHPVGERPASTTRDQTPLLAELRREGDHWRVGFGDRSATVADLKGLHHLAVLVARPGQEVHALDLALAGHATPPAGGGHTTSAALDRAGGDAGPLLDDAAKRAYREHLECLAEDLEEAQANNDEARAARARLEIDAVTGELSAAIGLAGRDRRAGADAERARVAVTKAIRSAVRRIDDHLPQLGAHLHASVRTGTFCRYDPDPSSRVRWRHPSG